ncbi:molybdopterin-guanine dinucleotide biosynthesis protein B [Priestia abyssalis]|uniref:molybdopterin-guanine dinucleotide biosynthesis protein B n=1 Tax=Priestia abyssalis TaxID=1221450 RepID=UPI000994EA59|nr:molybdopterin-guanine dinucleotide biosynthesis protein B [Priestia abyssalis]
MALGRKPSIFQIVGYQNSGKTTLAAKLIKRFTQEGQRVATIKHHGHGGMPAAGDEQKDTFCHREAGALITGVEGAGMLQIHARKEEWTLNDIIRLYEAFSMDVILIEGYKQAEYEKVVLIRSEEDLSLLRTLKNIICVISWVPLSPEISEVYPTFHIKDEKTYVEWLIERMGKSCG